MADLEVLRGLDAVGLAVDQAPGDARAQGNDQQARARLLPLHIGAGIGALGDFEIGGADFVRPGHARQREQERQRQGKQAPHGSVTV